MGEWGYHLKAKGNYDSLQMTEWRRPRKYRRSIEHPFPTEWRNDGSGIWRPASGALLEDLIDDVLALHDESAGFNQTRFAEHRHASSSNPSRSLRTELKKLDMGFDELMAEAGIG